MKARGGTTSIAARLVLLFMAGSSLIMVGVGYTLYHALRMQLDATNLEEIRGKTEVIEYMFSELETSEAFRLNLHRFRGLSVGHPDLSIGIRSGGTWLVKPTKNAVAHVGEDLAALSGSPYTPMAVGDRIWWVRPIHHAWNGPNPLEAVAILAIDTTETRQLLREHAAVAAIVAVLGTLLSGLLGWLVARRALAPIAQVAQRAGQVTAQRLGARLDLKDAPREVHGLGESVNLMLERLEESFRALEQFSADIAHELRTPLYNLLLQTQVTLSRPRTAAEYQEALHSNLTELERMQRTVADMLFLARADRGMLELVVEDVELIGEARSVTEYFEAAMAEQAQDVHFSGEARVRGDRVMIRRALTNLLSNSVRYSPPGSTIEVIARQGPGGGMVEVSNPGATLTAQEMARLFTRFARRDVSRGRETEGVGLGLAIVDSIMKLHGGRTEGQGHGGRFAVHLHFPPHPTPDRDSDPLPSITVR